jgi:segregation and condensation protein B
LSHLSQSSNLAKKDLSTSSSPSSSQKSKLDQKLAVHNPPTQVDTQEDVEPVVELKVENATAAKVEDELISPSFSELTIESIQAPDDKSSLEAKVEEVVLDDNSSPELEADLIVHAEKELSIELRSTLEASVKAKVEAELEFELRQELEPDLRVSLEAELTEDLYVELRTILEPKIEASLLPELENDLRTQLTQELTPAIKSELKEALMPALESEVKADLRGQLTEELTLTFKPELAVEIKEQLRKTWQPALTTELKNELIAELEAELRTEIEPELRQSVEAELVEELESELRVILEPKIKSELDEELRATLEPKIKSEIEKELKSALDDKSQVNLIEELKASINLAVSPEQERELRIKLEKELRIELIPKIKKSLEAELKIKAAQELRRTLNQEQSAYVENQSTVECDADTKRIVEAILFVADKPMTAKQIQNLYPELEKPELKTINIAIESIISDYNHRPIGLKHLASGYRFQVKEGFSYWISRLFEERPPRYSRALLETIAIIAYRQPVTRGDIEDIRGVSVSSSIIRTLLEREWVRIIAYKEVPGRPALYGTTKQFLDYFNLSSLETLPTLDEIKDLDLSIENLAPSIKLEENEQNSTKEQEREE